MLQLDHEARVRAAVAPMHTEGRISSPQTSQVLAGHLVKLLEQNGEWFRVRSADDYTGWMHRGYIESPSGTEADWRTSLGAVVLGADGQRRTLPVGARIADDVKVLIGTMVDSADRAHQFPLVADNIVMSAVRFYSGASYQWGGVTEFGLDCSGLVQSAFALHGLQLPRDAYQQEAVGVPIVIRDFNSAAERSELRDADLLFFSDREDRRITHVGIAMSEDRMLHSALGRGGVSVEKLSSAEDYVVRLRANFVSARRVITKGA
ncbi:MAG: C40 family peptidase [Gemmatimonas sp.]